jgi:peptidoglycan/LPS O-acetylase OafA/YrhL
MNLRSTTPAVVPTVRSGRNHTMDLLRILFATAVLLSHAPELTDGNPSRELLMRATHQTTFGGLGVEGFFLLSGYLILKSWISDPNLFSYLRKRVLRIVPGYLVAALLSTLFLGLLAPGVPHFLHHFTTKFFMSILLLGSPITPAVCPGVQEAQVNGSMWTIAYEFRCYLLVAFLGVLGLLRYRLVWLGVTLAFLTVYLSPRLQAMLYFHSGYYLFGKPDSIYWLTTTFLVGGCFLLFKDSIPFTPILAVLSAVIFLAIQLLIPQYVIISLVIFGGYLLFYLTSLRIAALDWMKAVPDISYGLYLYGWPVEIYLIWRFHASPWIVFAVSLLICVVLGWLSWEFVERPILKLKRKPSAPLTV